MKVKYATQLACDFCHKTQHQVSKLIAGPDAVCICDECVAECVKMIEDDQVAVSEYTAHKATT